MVTGFLIETGMAQTTALSNPTPAWVTVHKAGNQEHIAQPAGSSTVQVLPFQAAHWSKCLSAILRLYDLREGGA